MTHQDPISSFPAYLQTAAAESFRYLTENCLMTRCFLHPVYKSKNFIWISLCPEHSLQVISKLKHIRTLDLASQLNKFSAGRRFGLHCVLGDLSDSVNINHSLLSSALWEEYLIVGHTLKAAWSLSCASCTALPQAVLASHTVSAILCAP